MSIVEKIERFEGTSKLAMEAEDDAIIVGLTRLGLGAPRWICYLFSITLSLLLLGYLSYSFFDTPDGNAIWILWPIAYLFLIGSMLAEWHIRKGYYRDYRFKDGEVRILRSDYPNSPHRVPFIPRRVIVENTVPLIRGRLIIADPETAQTIRTGDSAPYVERYFVGDFLAKEFGAQFIAERELTDSENTQLSKLREEWERTRQH